MVMKLHQDVKVQLIVLRRKFKVSNDYVLKEHNAILTVDYIFCCNKNTMTKAT